MISLLGDLNFVCKRNEKRRGNKCAKAPRPISCKAAGEGHKKGMSENELKRNSKRKVENRLKKEGGDDVDGGYKTNNVHSTRVRRKKNSCQT